MKEVSTHEHTPEQQKELLEKRVLADDEAVRTGELSNREREAWRNVLGVDVEVKPLPEYVTSEVKQNLQGAGFRLRYIPALDLDNNEFLRQKGVEGLFNPRKEGYITELQRRYPNWKRLESLHWREKEDVGISRNLREGYWQAVEEGKIDFPVLPGQWMAVETVEKPEKGSKYPKTALVSDDRLNVSWDTVHKAIMRRKRRILSELGLGGRPVDLRLLEALEWNLLGNREGLGKTDTSEWTNTEYRGPGDNKGRLVIGNFQDGGAGSISWVRPSSSLDFVGFRVAVVLGP